MAPEFCNCNVGKWKQIIRYRDGDALRVNFYKLFVQSGDTVAVEIVHTYKKDLAVAKKLTCAGRRFGGHHDSALLLQYS